MVGDSQIGKTSLMVKYVEGSFDEDYIQTLGMSSLLFLSIESYIQIHSRRQLYGKDHICTADNDHILNMGSWRAERICQYATAGL